MPSKPDGVTAAYVSAAEIADLIYWKRMWDNQIHTRLRGFEQKGVGGMYGIDGLRAHLLEP